MRSMHSFMFVFKRIHIFTALVISTVFFFSCTPVSRSTGINPYAFKDVPPADKRQFVVMNDSSIVYGEKVRGWGTGLVNKKVVHISDKTIPASEVLGYQTKEAYWTKLEYNSKAYRVMEGRISVYRGSVDLSNGGSYTKLFFQKAGGPVKEISGMGELKQMLSDCPKAYDMINIPDDEYMKIVKKQPYFLQTVIEAYNNCVEWQ